MINIDELKKLNYEDGKALLINAGYNIKARKENYQPCNTEYEYATDIYFVKDSEDKLQEVDRICCTIYSDEYIYTNEDEDTYNVNVLDSDTFKTIWQKEDPRITKAGVLANLKKFIGKNIDDDIDVNVCEAFEDYDEKGETCMSCEKSQDNSYTYVASIDTEYPTPFIITTNNNNIITDVWVQ